MNSLQFTKEVIGLSEMFNLPEVIKIFEPYQGSELRSRKRALRRVEQSDTHAYVVPVNPDLNYGVGHKVFYLLESHQGLFLNELRATSALSTMPLREIVITSKNITFTGKLYPNTYETRKFLKDHRIITTQI